MPGTPEKDGVRWRVWHEGLGLHVFADSEKDIDAAVLEAEETWKRDGERRRFDERLTLNQAALAAKAAAGRKSVEDGVAKDGAAAADSAWAEIEAGIKGEAVVVVDVAPVEEKP